MKKLLRNTKRLLDKTFGSKIDEIYWQFRHVFGNRKWAEKYLLEASLNHPHRKFIIDKIASYIPFKTILEIGCASGPNLYLLAKKFPEVKLYGIDISKKAVETGNELLKKEGISNVKLYTGKADELGQFPDKSFDVVFTDATLIYVAPDKINKVIGEMLRVARKAVILNEWYKENPKSFYNDHWVHNYKLLFKQFILEEKIKFTKLPKIYGTGIGPSSDILSKLFYKL